MSVIIRQAIDTDKEIFAAFAMNLSRFNRSNHEEQCKYDDFEEVLCAIKAAAEKTFDERNDDVYIIIALVDEKPVGYAMGKIYTQELTADNGTGRMGLLDELFLDDSARGHGIGKMLIDDVMAWFKSKGIARVKLHAYSWNRNAISVYEKYGFREYAVSYETFIYHREDNYIKEASSAGGINMSNQAELWNSVFEKFGSRTPKCDGWLDKHGDILEFSKDTPIVDLGCGFGNDTLYLYEKGYDVISCDFSIESLKIIERLIPNPKTKLFDILEGLPFQDSSIKLIISDLSLHYFCWKDTVRAVNDIKRALVPGGYLLCRVNSINDINYGAGQGTKLEENYYNVDGRLKRFFDETQLEALFSDWKITYLQEYNMDRYKSEKIVWEIAVQKK